MLTLLDILAKTLWALLALIVLALAILGAPMGTTAGFLGVLVLVNWGVLSIKKAKQRKQQPTT